jgi:Pvc16 N-terminal domain/IPT/TIG domain
MADFSGIQAVTETLRRLLLDRMHERATLTDVTTASLDTDEAPDGPWVNLFLYRITENAELKNQELSGMGGPLSLGHPPLSVNLHYLVTTMGLDSADTRGAHRVLGDVMLTLHDHPVVAKDDPVLDPGLRQEVELLKITLEPLATEELSNIWTATTAPYRLSVAYRVTVVQLESTLPQPITRQVGAPPEAGPRVYAVPLDRPQISAVGVRRDPDGEVEPVPSARLGDTLVVDGGRLHPGRRVLLGEVDATAAVDGASTGSRLLVTVPDEPALQPGIHRLQLVGDVPIGDPPRGVPVMRSNVAAFVLIPTVSSTAPAGGAPGSTLTITGERLAADGGSTIVLIGNRAVTPDSGATATRATVTVPELPSGVHPVSVRVNGAESVDPASFEVTP